LACSAAIKNDQQILPFFCSRLSPVLAMRIVQGNSHRLIAADKKQRLEEHVIREREAGRPAVPS
jgi:hypothetical protein